MKHIYMIFGQKQSGKGTISDFIQYHYYRQPGTGCWAFGFSDPIKRSAMQILGMPHSVAFGGEEARTGWVKYGKNARQWLQRGAELRNEVDPDIWIHRLLERVKVSPYDYGVITDCRFPNELSELRKAYPGRVTAVLVLRGLLKSDDRHETEMAVLGMPWSDFDHVLVNDGNLEDLEAKVQEILQ